MNPEETTGTWEEHMRIHKNIKAKLTLNVWPLHVKQGGVTRKRVSLDLDFIPLTPFYFTVQGKEGPIGLTRYV